MGAVNLGGTIVFANMAYNLMGWPIGSRTEFVVTLWKDPVRMPSKFIRSGVDRGL